MQEVDSTERLYEAMEKKGWRCKVASIARVGELEREIRSRRRDGELDETLYGEYLASFDFDCIDSLEGARSMIIASVPQPMERVVFEWENKSHPVIIPPTYASSVDKSVADFLDSVLSPPGRRFKKVRLPQKLIAARSGLAKYGRNNIAYIPGAGSFHRPVVFVSDFPCPSDDWGEAAALDHCEGCDACLKACPARAIGSDRFLLHAERCLTFHNERSHDFPVWISPSWHNSLVGCMICQKVCPANKSVKKWIEDVATFEEDETALILNGAPEDRFLPGTLEKLDRLGMMEYFDMLGRNLKAIL